MKNRKKQSATPAVSPSESRQRLLKVTEIAANIGLIFVAVGLVSPVVGFQEEAWLIAFKWIFAAGAAIYTIARLAGAFGGDESFRIRRLRRMEVWAGLAFCIGAFFWFYNTRHIAEDTMRFLSFKMFQETIVFTLVGAMIQIIASWMLSSALRKQQGQDGK